MSALTEGTRSSNPLRRWRKQHHVTQAKLAADMGVHPSVVSQWEKRYSMPSLPMFHRLQRHTGIAVHTLLRFFDPLPPAPMNGGVIVPFTRLVR